MDTFEYFIENFLYKISAGAKFNILSILFTRNTVSYHGRRDTMKRIACFAGTLLSLYFTTATVSAENFDINAGFTIGVQQGDYADIVDRNAFGLSVDAVYTPESFPVGFGLDISFMNYGSEERRENFSSTIPDVRVDVENTNNMATMCFLVRYRPIDKGAVSPYLDGLFGFRYLYTDTEITSDYEVIASDTNFDDFAGTYGFGGGVGIKLHTFDTPMDDGKLVTLYLDLKVRYMKGGEAEYLKEGSIIRDGSSVSYESYKSYTDMMVYVIGLGVRF